MKKSVLLFLLLMLIPLSVEAQVRRYYHQSYRSTFYMRGDGAVRWGNGWVMPLPADPKPATPIIIYNQVNVTNVVVNPILVPTSRSTSSSGSYGYWPKNWTNVREIQYPDNFKMWTDKNGTIHASNLIPELRVIKEPK